MIEINKIYNNDCLVGMKEIPSNSIDVILTDPPYKYLKNQKLEVDFDETIFFNEVKRVLKKDGFIILFGRGTSFYRWNTMLADLGFNFKEEFIWDKGYCTSPLMAISRIHETISIHSKGKGIIKKVKINYLEMKSHDINSICQDIKRMKSILNNTVALDAVLSFLESNLVPKNKDNTISTSISSIVQTQDRSASVLAGIKNGLNEKTIIRTDRVDCDTFTKFGVNSDKRQTGDRCVNVTQSIEFGLNEKSIIKQTRDHYTAIHPTQKPVRLLERLLALTTKEGDLVLDPFSGSASTAEACINTNRNFIGFEIDNEYFEKSIKRISSIERTLFSTAGTAESVDKN